jgi:hypothetical protein
VLKKRGLSDPKVLQTPGAARAQAYHCQSAMHLQLSDEVGRKPLFCELEKRRLIQYEREDKTICKHVEWKVKIELLNRHHFPPARRPKFQLVHTVFGLFVELRYRNKGRISQSAIEGTPLWSRKSSGWGNMMRGFR